jgi:putative acetyltransferase
MIKSIIRPIEAPDNPAVKQLVLDTLAEFGLFGDGFAGVDAELEDMHAAYNNDLSAYFVVEVAGVIAGVGGYAPLHGTEPGSIAELRKMYLSADLRGQGMGQKLIDICLNEVKEKNYQSMYLETVPTMKAAQKLYLKNGFTYLDGPLGDTGHCNCSVRMLRKLYD